MWKVGGSDLFVKSKLRHYNGQCRASTVPIDNKTKDQHCLCIVMWWNAYRKWVLSVTALLESTVPNFLGFHFP